MKVFYLDPKIFPGSFNFKNEVVGISGTDIDFVDTYSKPSGGTLQIISEFDGHKKILEFYQPNDAEDSYFDHEFGSVQTDKSYEFYIAKPTGANYNTYIHFLEDGTTRIYLLFQADDIKYNDGAWKDVKLNCINNNKLHHIRITWDDTNNIFDFYLDGVLEGDNLGYYSNSTTGIDEIRCILGDLDYTVYFDAVGESWDANYTIGENLYEKWHVSTQTQVTNIVTYPNPVQQNNAFTACVMVLGDFEGSLYAKWSVLDQVKMRIEDDSDNVLWRGFLDNKRFTSTGLTLELVSFGRQLEWKSFGSKERVDYIMDKGIVDLCNASSIIDLKDDEGAPCGWTPDCWIGEDKDLGFMILDNTTEYEEKTWDISAITPTGAESTSGGVADTQTFDDGNYYYAKDTKEIVDLVINLDIDGIVIPDTEELKEIEIQFNWRMRIRSRYYVNNSTVKLQIKKDTEWITFSKVQKERYMSATNTNWLTGVPTEEGGTPIENGNDSQEVITGTDDELQKYFDKDNGNYSKLKGLRFIVSGSRGDDDYDYTQVYIDFIKVIVRHHAEDVLPIMYSITDNAATTITCSEVANWQLMGITDDSDRFYIGQNTRKIIDDISTQSGVAIEIIDPGTPSIETVEPNNDQTCQWKSTSGAGEHHASVIDENDGTRIYAEAGDEDKIEVFLCDTEILYPYVYISQLKIYTRGSCFGSADYRPTFDIHWEGDWLGLNEIVELPIEEWGWTSNIITGLWGSQKYLDNLAIKYTACSDFGEMGNSLITEIYIEATVITPNFHKYMAREFKGCHCIDPLKAVCKLEGAEWVEDHINEKIKILKPNDFEDSGISITTGGVIDWEFEDKCNAVSQVHVWGNSKNEVYANAKDPSIDSLKSKQIIDEKIMTNADAQEIADDALALWKTKRSSIRIPLLDTYPALVLGKTANITFVRPTIAGADYKIKMIERVKFGKTGIITIVHCGLGEARSGVKEVREIGIEKIEKEIRLASDLAHKSMTDKL